MTRIWLAGLLRRRLGRLAGVAVGVALSVALLASLGTFLSAAKATMTHQAVRSVAVDWQVAVGRNAPLQDTFQAVRSEPGTKAALIVGYATSGGLSATTASTVRTTATATVLGLPPDYVATFPSELRPLSGSATLSGRSGVSAVTTPLALLAQQTASNLGARVGDTVTVARAGLPPFAVRVVGVVDLPQSDTLFQTVGAATGSQPSAPPDNVVIVDYRAWQTEFTPLATLRPDLVANQIHVQRTHALATDPSAAYSQALAAGHHMESRLVGAGSVGDNLATTLSAARQDALYAQVLFVFLGLPGAALAAALTGTVAAAGSVRRRREQSLLRLRGATGQQILRLAALEGTLVGVVGCTAGIGAALVVGWLAFRHASFGASISRLIVWMALAAVVGLAIAEVSVLGPARRDMRQSTVVAGRQVTARAARQKRSPLALRLFADLWLLAGAAVVYSITSQSGYSLVLAPDGVPSISVSYWAFAGPAMLWVGAGLLTWRLVDLLLRRGRWIVARSTRAMSGPLSGLAAASASRRSRLLASASVLATLSIVFAASTAVFNETYRAQARVDARLTNGADVAIAVPPGTQLAAGTAARIAQTPGVHTVEPLLHRYAYIGTDLQDLYGVRPNTVAKATSLQNAYFSGGTASSLMALLAARPDSILVSSETVKDYQLRLGDPITLRLQDTHAQRTAPVTFHYAGIVKEFPTAPRDSFFVTNAAYVASATSNPSVGTFLIGTSQPPHPVADRLRAMLGPGPAITDVSTTTTIVGSSLTAVDLAGLTKVELGFALVLAVASGGLVLGLGLAERRRDLAIVAAIGGRRRQLRALVHVDAAVVTIAALLGGALGGAVLSQVLVKVLTGVFDPAPASLAVPWPYLALVGGLMVIGVGVASRLVSNQASKDITATLRDL
jgi:putative ABC transport system permease protein